MEVYKEPNALLAHSPPHKSCEFDDIIPLLYMRKLKLAEIKSLA